MAYSPMYTPVDDQNNAIGGSQTIVIPAGVGTTVIKGRPGRLCTVIVTAAATSTGVTTIYDNASAGSGTPLFVTPLTVAAGTVTPIGAPALNGLVAVGAANSPALTVVFS